MESELGKFVASSPKALEIKRQIEIAKIKKMTFFIYEINLDGSVY
jgi:hypothetical protein